MSGYKSMLRDRMPRMMSLALKYCKAKEDWIEHCYNNFIRVVPQSERSVTVKEMLGICKKPGCKKLLTQDDYIMMALYGYKRKDIPTQDLSQLYYTFKETIDWEGLDDSEVNFWTGVCNAVNWFSKTYAYIENDYRISVSIGKSEEFIKDELKSRYKLDDNLLRYLINSFKNGN